MDPESAASAGLIGVLLVAMRIIERSVDNKKNGNGNGLTTKVAIAEEKLESLGDRVDEVSSKTREALSNTYEILRRMDINEAIEKDRRQRNDTRQDQRTEVE